MSTSTAADVDDLPCFILFNSVIPKSFPYTCLLTFLQITIAYHIKGSKNGARHMNHASEHMHTQFIIND